jgi:phosphohistidine phosphatase
MKRLFLIRHAKSSWDNPNLPDIKRPLNDRGQRDAPRMAKRLKEKEITPDFMITSPAVRAMATAEALADILRYTQSKIKTDSDLYHADEDTLLRVVQNLSDKYDTVMLFGHNPGLTDFAERLTNVLIRNIPTCGIVACSFLISSWREVNWGKAKLDFFDFPKK